MSDRPVDPELLARYLRQRGELGAGDLFLGTMDRGEALEAAAALVRSVGKGSVRQPAPEPSAEPVGASGDYAALKAAALECTQCRLHQGRTNVVFSDGVPDARVMVIGEAPGANEDKTGLPFVGQAGKLLDLLLAAVDLSRKRNVYICNVLKCRPPGNRNPEPDEIEQCAPYLKSQIEWVEPEVLLAVGTFAAQWLTGTKTTLGKLRGTIHTYQGVPVVVTYHPAALLRNPGWTRSTWDDLQLLREVLERR